MNPIVSKIDSWGNFAVEILLAIVKWGGIIAFIGLAIFLYFNNDETGAKRAKIAMAIIFAATFIAWFAPLIINSLPE